MSRTSPRKKTQASVESKAPAVRKGAATKAKSPTTSRAAGAKRKVKHEEDEEVEVEACDSCAEGEGEDEDEDEEKPVKRRKTAAPKASKASKASKADDMAPLATRTVVSTLKRAMYIGAHVSGAGGKHSLSLQPPSSS